MPRRITAALVAALALVTLAACGDDSGTTAAETTSTTAAARAERVVSLSPTATEILFAIHAGDSVVAVDDQSTYPSEAPKTSLSGYQPNVEAIARYNPDVVVISNDLSDVVKGLKRLGIRTLLQPAAASLDDTYAQIRALGRETGHERDAAALVASMRSEIAEIAKQVPARPQPATYYYELDDTYYSLTSTTFVGRLFARAGLRSIADTAPDDAGGYPQLQAEFVVQANPDYVFLADTKCCKQSAQTVGARPGWAEIAAVKNGRVIELDDDIASRWGPRVVDLFRAVVEAQKAA
jgi:iron complex transport system substrate-binding protein